MKFKHIDHLAGFLLALLTAMPMLRTQFAIPSIALILPIMAIFVLSVIKNYDVGRLFVRKNVAVHFYFIVLLFVYLLASNFWNPFDVSTRDPMLRIFLIILTAAAVIGSLNERVAVYYINWVIFFAVFAAVTLFGEYIRLGNFSGYRLSDTLVRPQLMGLGTIFTVGKLLFLDDRKKKRLIATIGFLLLGLAFGGARGALILTFGLSILILIYYFYLNDPKSYSLAEWFKNKSLRIFSFGSIILVIVAALQVERTAHKMRRLFFGGELVSGGRAELWVNSVSSFLESPIIGHGFRSSGMLSYGRESWYPHNLFLEAMVDGGIIALIILLIVCFYPLIRTIELFRKKLLNGKLWLPLMVGYIFLLFEFSKSNSIYEGRILMALGIVMLIVVERIKLPANQAKRAYQKLE